MMVILHVHFGGSFFEGQDMSDKITCLNCHAELEIFPGQCKSCGYINEKGDAKRSFLPITLIFKIFGDLHQCCYPPISSSDLDALTPKTKMAVICYFKNEQQMTKRQRNLIYWLKSKDLALIDAKIKRFEALRNTVAFFKQF